MLEFTFSSKGAKELIVDGHIFQKSKTNYSKNQKSILFFGNAVNTDAKAI
jgi:hypothetical protein